MAVVLKSRGFSVNRLTIDDLVPMQLITVDRGTTVYVVLGVDDGPTAVLYNVELGRAALFNPGHVFWEAQTGTEVSITQE